MKLNQKMIAITLAVGLGAFAVSTTQAAVYKDTTRGPRLTTTSVAPMQGERLTTLEDFKNLRKGDKIASWCPMMKKTIMTTVRNVDTKGHVKIEETKEGLKMNGCNIVLRRQGASKEVRSLMVCPDGTLTPIECRKL